LAESDSDAFENHYIGCDACHEIVTTLQFVKAELASEPVTVPVTEPAEHIVPMQNQDSNGRILKFRTPFPARLLAFGSLAAALLVAAVLTGIVLIRHSTSTAASIQSNGNSTVAPGSQTAPSPGQPTVPNGPAQPAQPTETQIASLADLHLPGYQLAQLRGAEITSNADAAPHAEFVAGMKLYAKGDCRRALAHLTAVPFAAGDGSSATLYSGLCQLKQHALDRAQGSFERIVAAGDSPQLETAEFFLAQTSLLRGDKDHAKTWLASTIALRGDYEVRARNQRALLLKSDSQP
jgi:hypothetical protein